MNTAYCYILATMYEEKTKTKLNWNLFPRIALYRAFQKAYVNFDILENTLHKIDGTENSQELFNGITESVIIRKMGEDFCDWVKIGCGTLEERIYKAATRIATIIEFQEIKKKIINSDEQSNEIIKGSIKYYDIPGFLELLEEPDLENPEDKKPIKVLRDISRLKNIDRWSVYSHTVKCSVLGHLFDTGIIAYFVSLEKGLSEEDATKNFFIDIFHDVPETYTGDIPSPIKDSVKGFRQKSEEFELEMMELKFYPYFSPTVRNAIKDVMMETTENKNRKKIEKIADYVSAISEIWRQAVKGCRDRAFYKTLIKHRERLYKFGAEQTEITFFNEVEKYCRKTLVVDEIDYYIVLIEITCDDIRRSKKVKRTRKLYRRLLQLGYQLEKSGADEFEIARYYELKRGIQKYL